MVKTKVKHLVNEVNSLSTENKSDENKPNDRPDVSSDEGLTLDTFTLSTQLIIPNYYPLWKVLKSKSLWINN